MNKVEFTSGNFTNTTIQAAEVRKWREAYDNLIAALGGLGTEVRIVRTLETDEGVAPGTFIRSAYHHFVFPPQEVIGTIDHSKEVDPTAGQQLYRQDITREYDDALVAGEVEVTYDDANSRIVFGVADKMNGESHFEAPVLDAVAQVAQLADAAQRQ